MISQLHRSEHGEQSALIQWAAAMLWKYPDLRMLYAVPNQGAGRNKRLQKEGVRKGVNDLNLDTPRGSFHGLRIEMKAKGGKLSPEQQEWLQALREQGYCTAVCVGFDAAREVIENYLKMRVGIHT